MLKRPVLLIALFGLLSANACTVRSIGSAPSAPSAPSTTNTPFTTPPTRQSPAAPAPVPAPSTGGVPTLSGNNLVTLSGQARSVESTAPTAAVGSVHLSGASALTVSADIVDGSGRDHGNGTLTAQGGDVVLTGSGLQVGGTLRIQPSSVTVNNASVVVAPNTTITSGRLTFQAPAPSPPAGASVTPSSPPPITLNGPVSVRSTSAVSASISGANVAWIDAPAVINVSSSEADLSWAGTGSINAASGPVKAGYLGVRGQQLSASLQRAGGQVAVQGTGLALQIYADGVPQVRVPARFEILNTHATTGSFFTLKPAFVWTPRNLSSIYDMAILRIRPGNAAANGVHVGLRPMPAMFGGEPHALVGGLTSGLRGGDAIDSLIARNGDDKRSIGYDGPVGSTLVLVVEGNFDPITITIQTS